jgi:hypothetical protein
MKRFIIGVAVAAAMLAVPAVSSAKVDRYQEQTATFTVNQPKDAVSQWGNVWRHEFKVTVNPCDDTFVGTAPTFDNGATTPTWTEKVTGSFDNGKVSFVTDPIGGGATFKVKNAPMNNSIIRNVETTWTANEIEFKISPKTVTDSSDWKNHGEYVSSMGGGSDAAHSCIGMPIH